MRDSWTLGPLTKFSYEEKNIIKKAGSWFSYEDTKLGQGRDAVKALFAENPDLAEEIENKIKAALAAEAAPAE